MARSGAKNNTVDNMTIERMPGAVGMYGVFMTDTEDAGVSSENNTFKNIHMKDVTIAISARTDTGSVARNNVFDNNVIDNSDLLFQCDHVMSSNNLFRNNTIISVPTLTNVPANMQMSTAAGSFSGNTLDGCGFTLP